MSEKRKGYPSDVSDEEWSFCVNYLTLMREVAPQRECAQTRFRDEKPCNADGRASNQGRGQVGKNLI